MFDVFFIVEGDSDILPFVAEGAFDKTIELQSEGRFLIESGDEHAWLNRKPEYLIYDESEGRFLNESGAEHDWLDRKPEYLIYDEDELAAIEDIVQGRAWDFWHLETSYPNLETLIARSVMQSGLVLAVDTDNGPIFDASRFSRLIETCDRWYLYGREPGET